MKTRIQFLTFNFILFFAISSYTQSLASLTGKVIDEETKERLIYASIVLKQDEVYITGAFTNLEGEYIIDNLLPGKYQIEVSYVGYMTRIIELEIQNNIQKDLSLKQGVIVCEVFIVCNRISVDRCFWGCGGTVTSTDCYNDCLSGGEDIENEEEAEIVEFSKEANFYPNPSPGPVNFKSEGEITEMELRSITGKLIWTKQIDGSFGSIDLSGLQTGYYIVRYVEDGSLKAKKIAKVAG